jgi:hypothetical protein
MVTIWAAAAVLLSVLPGEPGGAAPPSPAPPPRTCSAPEHRQFDFWLGDWDVLDPAGAAAGTNLVTAELDGCMLQEHWRSADGKQMGTSLNHFDPASATWSQTWVDNTAGFLVLTGAFRDGRMVLTGDKAMPGGGRVTNRISWERTGASGVHVRQLWERSADGGKTWTVVFDGTYVRKKGPRS